MHKLSATSGTLAIMMGSGVIADFEVVEAGSEIFVRVWPQYPEDDARLRKQVAALLPHQISERHVLVIHDGA
jgi:hypothetical protein